MILKTPMDEFQYDKNPSIFLAGPSPTDSSLGWREDVLQLLNNQPLLNPITVFSPLPFCGDYKQQIDWECHHLEQATVIMFWIPRDLKTLPGFTTNIEFGEWLDSGKIVLGFPEDAPKMQYLEYRAETLGIPIFHTLEETTNYAVKIAIDALIQSVHLLITQSQEREKQIAKAAKLVLSGTDSKELETKADQKLQQLLQNLEPNDESLEITAQKFLKESMDGYILQLRMKNTHSL